jgi:deoxyribodipyrimidine photo-lyase
MKETAIVWFRTDLRVADNEALTIAMNQATNVIPVYIFDSRLFNGKTKFGFRKVGKHRCQFIIEAVHDLRNSFKCMGIDIVVRVGLPEEILPQLTQEFKASWIFCNREMTSEEIKVQDKLERNLWAIGKEVVYSRGKMLYYTSDLPFPVAHMPDTFTTFRKEVEKLVKVREPLPSISSIYNLIMDKIDFGEIPNVKDFGHEGEVNLLYKGGETEGLRHLNYYLWDTNLIAKYKESRNGLLGRDYSSKFSPYLAQGCLSPKTIYHEVKKYEETKVENESTYWLIFELLWRDFFRLIGKKYGNKIFQLGGSRAKKVKCNEDKFLFDKWASGTTGVPFIDANMRELNATGFMSNRGRQNVASFLVNDLKVNWLMGAEYFESLLIDYDPCSNYGNWSYLAGVGNDPREDRYFNINTQVKKYDDKCHYIKHWVKEVAALPEEFAYRPQYMPSQMSEKFNFILGKDYPKPIVKLPQ